MKIVIERNASYDLVNMVFVSDTTEIIENVIDINFDYSFVKKYDENKPFDSPKKAILILYTDNAQQTALNCKYIYLFEKDSIQITE